MSAIVGGLLREVIGFGEPWRTAAIVFGIGLALSLLTISVRGIYQAVKQRTKSGADQVSSAPGITQQMVSLAPGASVSGLEMADNVNLIETARPTLPPLPPFIPEQAAEMSGRLDGFANKLEALVDAYEDAPNIEPRDFSEQGMQKYAEQQSADYRARATKLKEGYQPLEVGIIVAFEECVRRGFEDPELYRALDRARRTNFPDFKRELAVRLRVLAHKVKDDS